MLQSAINSDKTHKLQQKAGNNRFLIKQVQISRNNSLQQISINKETFEDQLTTFVKEHIGDYEEEPKTMKEFYLRFQGLKQQERQEFLEEFGQQHKLSSKQILDYIDNTWSKTFAYQLSPEEKNEVKMFVFANQGMPIQQLYNNILTGCLKGNRDVHPDTLRQTIKYYYKQASKKQQKRR